MSDSFRCEDQPDVTIPEDTIVRARLEELKVETFSWNDKRTGERKEAEKLIWWFEITEDGPQGLWMSRRIKGETGAKLTNHPNNRFRAWSESLLGRDIPVGFQLSTEDLVGTACKITVRHEPDRKDPKQKWERIDEVLPGGGFDDNPPF